MYDTIIIGAGMSGLAAGIRLAYYDRKVCILERHNTIGGLNSFYRLNRRDYDVGLHAVTNFTPRGAKKGPLARLLRQLRFRWEDFSLSEQMESAIAFPGVQLRFNNDPELLRSEIAKHFPHQLAAYDALLERIVDYDDLDQDLFGLSTRKILSELFSEPMLVEMLLCPLMWYGNAREHDMDFGQFCIMFRSIFLEGFARPYKGVRLILKNLVRRFRELGGELKLRHGVREIKTDGNRAIGVILDDGQELEGRVILSSAGRPETLRMTGRESPQPLPLAGEMSFVETISILDRQPRAFGHERTIVFFNDSSDFHWERPRRELVDLRTGVICSPNNFRYDPSDGELPEGVIRITAIADHERWGQLDEPRYRLEKLKWFDRVAQAAVRFMPDYRRYAIDSDMFTPNTIRRFTWHDNGAVYGAPEKVLDGATPFEGLYLCGTDQGYVGIIGSIISGVTIANRYCLAT